MAKRKFKVEITAEYVSWRLERRIGNKYANNRSAVSFIVFVDLVKLQQVKLHEDYKDNAGPRYLLVRFRIKFVSNSLALSLREIMDLKSLVKLLRGSSFIALLS